MLPSILAKQLEKGIGDYIETTFPMTNAPFKGSVQNLLGQKNAVTHEPYTAVRLPFRTADKMPSCFKSIHPAYLPYVHQQKAFDRLTGDDGMSTLIATGTGSGKTECFLYPILEYCYRHRAEQGIKALIIYPMNALASDQAKRIAELIYGSDELRGNVSVGMYVGGGSHTAARGMSPSGVITDHETLLNRPPDILLTNYKMLDYLLVRPKDARLWADNKPETLKYIVVDEMHTFDGAQGTDLACLLRRLKRRLGIYDGTLCCIGTSATMGTKDDSKAIRDYAADIFNEPFDRDAVITEDRLSADEFFAGIEPSEFALPTAEQMSALETFAEQDDADEYLKAAVKAWFPAFHLDPLSNEGRIRLGELLKRHEFTQALIQLTGGNYWQASAIVEKLRSRFPALKALPDPTAAIDSLYALISHARTGSPEAPRPFLNVQVQLWMRELRRLIAKVNGEEVTYMIANDLNKTQAKQYLPVVNCRDCGLTGWVSVLNERLNASLPKLETFYNLYFKADKKVVMLFPMSHKEPIPDMDPAWICPDCLQVKLGDEGGTACPNCGQEMISVMIPNGKNKTSGTKKNQQYECPCCGSKRGLSLMGVRSATEISASISQMFASRFNDDKKTLAFSDNVQDAAHRAGFFNARTWRFGLRTAIQKYTSKFGAGQSLEEFQEGFLNYWHGKMTAEEFTSFFIAPNMTWMRAYEEMIANRKLGSGESARKLMYEVEQRVKYEIMLEFGLASRIGRTLEKSGCGCLSFASEDINAIAAAVRERTENEIGILRDENEVIFRRMVLGFLNLMRSNGAFADKVFDKYTESNGDPYTLSNERNRWLPGLQSGRNTPRFLCESLGSRPPSNFDTPTSRKYFEWVKSCCGDILANESWFIGISKIILEEAVKQSVIAVVPSSPQFKVYGLNKSRVYITDKVVQTRCGKCGSVYAVSEENAPLWIGAPCRRPNCAGTLAEYEPTEINYYGRLYSSGDIERVNAKEHTGLLSRPDREHLEDDFKRGKDSRALWDPNVLSCTPTLEMGIDIGDLSTVILCSMPPSQSQFLQRAGRAGRKDGNALTLAVANAKPHDLYFYADPSDMISGKVTPPKVFLQASAVLERQFVAFCMDSWVKTGIPEKAIPEKVGTVLRNMDKRPVDMYPYNFLEYVKNNLSKLVNMFTQMFTSSHDDSWREELQSFARGKDGNGSRMALKIIDAFESLKNQRQALKDSVEDLADMIKELEDKPKDSSYDEQIKELKSEQAALLRVLQELNDKNIFNFLSDEGLLPNYAFPEAGVVLRAVLSRKEDSNPAAPKNNPNEKLVYEFNRSASSAISEFAPNNSFYADGHKLTINQIDLTTTKAEKWRLCPNCSHAQLEEAGKNTACCPQCGSPSWADIGQVRSMLKVQMVYANGDYTKSLISDESDERTNTFYCKQLLVDVDEAHDISEAYKMGNEDFPFGYEFVRKATLREINFGENDMTGPKLFVSGVEDVRKGFKICKYCGRIQHEGEKPNHSYTCRTRKDPSLANAQAYEECLFLYREFTTEILRLLVPATTMDSENVKLESFVAAFMLGMKEHFGNVDHLRAAVCEVPVPNAVYRKQYLVIYDSVPGGTGYLKQLMHEKNALIEIFEKALRVLEKCSCKDDPQKDGCYHCLYAYRQSQQIGNISRRTAMALLKSILSGKDNIEKIRTISEISANPIFDSELERRFMEAIRSKSGASDFHEEPENGKHIYYVKYADCSWKIEPQVYLSERDGVSVPCKPDFVFWPLSDEQRKPVAVFTDGFTVHNIIASDDTKKREAIRRSGKFYVWSLSYNDVQNIFEQQTGYYTETLSADAMPYGPNVYQSTVIKAGADAINPQKQSSFQLLIEYLKRPDAEDLFKAHAHAYGLSLLNPGLLSNETAFNSWKCLIKNVNEQAHFTDLDCEFGKTAFGTWAPDDSDSYLTVYAGISLAGLNSNGPVSVCAVLNDSLDTQSAKYKEVWNGFWRFWNVMQFSENFMAVSTVGLDQFDYSFPIMEENAAPVEALPYSPWDKIMECLFDDGAKSFAKAARDSGIPAPEEEYVGYEVPGKNDETIATLEFAWPDRKIAFMTEEQLNDREVMEKLGWRILSQHDSVDASVLELFGGDEK